MGPFTSATHQVTDCSRAHPLAAAPLRPAARHRVHGSNPTILPSFTTHTLVPCILATRRASLAAAFIAFATASRNTSASAYFCALLWVLNSLLDRQDLGCERSLSCAVRTCDDDAAGRFERVSEVAIIPST